MSLLVIQDTSTIQMIYKVMLQFTKVAGCHEINEKDAKEMQMPPAESPITIIWQLILAELW